MTIEERVERLEDAVIHLGNIMEHQTMPFSSHVDPTVVSEGRLFWTWAKAMQADRPGD